ncbi:hypothetical protein FQN57_006306 [Myotisia sp. PD_48]|nr:hypothetical protein FQN57_006306 [Myotisia sp. PD_48]
MDLYGRAMQKPPIILIVLLAAAAVIVLLLTTGLCVFKRWENRANSEFVNQADTSADNDRRICRHQKSSVTRTSNLSSNPSQKLRLGNRATISKYVGSSLRTAQRISKDHSITRPKQHYSFLQPGKEASSEQANFTTGSDQLAVRRLTGEQTPAVEVSPVFINQASGEQHHLYKHDRDGQIRLQSDGNCPTNHPESSEFCNYGNSTFSSAISFGPIAADPRFQNKDPDASSSDPSEYQLRHTYIETSQAHRYYEIEPSSRPASSRSVGSSLASLRPDPLHIRKVSSTAFPRVKSDEDGHEFQKNTRCEDRWSGVVGFNNEEIIGSTLPSDQSDSVIESKHFTRYYELPAAGENRSTTLTDDHQDEIEVPFCYAEPLLHQHQFEDHAFEGKGKTPELSDRGSTLPKNQILDPITDEYLSVRGKLLCMWLNAKSSGYLRS